jgi:predicted flap endonuclease-1-like 5' DNA nuclease
MMQTNPSLLGCPGICWATGMAFGLLVAVLLGFGIVAGLLCMLVIGAGAAVFLQWAFCQAGAQAHLTPQAHPECVPMAQGFAMSEAVSEASSDAAPLAVEDGAPEAASPDKPVMLAAARGGKSDNLKQIKGIGPKLEALLNRMGVFHLEQIAGWHAAQVAWVDANLDGFKGRVSRDAWVAQARSLTSGADAEIARSVDSRSVDKGEVY